MEGRGDGARLKAVVVRLFREGRVDRFDRADRLREELHARGALDEHGEHGGLLDGRGRDQNCGDTLLISQVSFLAWGIGKAFP
jgi:hypothetical protein